MRFRNLVLIGSLLAFPISARGDDSALRTDLYEESFDTPGLWPEIRRSDLGTSVVEGRYVIIDGDAQPTFVGLELPKKSATGQRLSLPRPNGDFSFQVAVELEHGDEGAALGVAWGGTKDKYLAFVIVPAERLFRVVARDRSRETEVLGWQTTEAIQTGMNVVGVRRDQGVLEIIINGQVLTNLTVPRPFGNRFGVACFGRARIAVDRMLWGRPDDLATTGVASYFAAAPPPSPSADSEVSPLRPTQASAPSDNEDDATRARASAARAARDWSTAIAAYEELRARSRASVRDLLELMACYDETAQHDRIEPLLRDALLLDPDHPDVNLELGMLLSDRHDCVAAMTHFERALAHAPGLVTAILEKALCQLEMNELVAASVTLDRALALEPTNVDALTSKGLIYAKWGNAEADRYFAAAVQATTNDQAAQGDVYYRWAMAVYLLGDARRYWEMIGRAAERGHRDAQDAKRTGWVPESQ